MANVAKNAFYAQSGGVTAVINASACGLIETARQSPQYINKIFAGRNGIIGALTEDLIDTSFESDQVIAGLLHTPSGAFGSCRYKLKGLAENRQEYERLIQVFRAHDIGYFFYNGGGDSQDTAYKVSQISSQLGYPIACIGIPKTIDNDLPFTDNCPGFGSVAKYIAISTLEASMDVAAMAHSSTKVFILEVMGRHAGWIAAASSLAKRSLASNDAPHIILFPEIPFEIDHFCQLVRESVETNGYCTIVASEGIKNADGTFLSASGSTDAFGHSQLGGVASTLAQIIKKRLNLKYHYAIADYLQRSARHIASQIDVEQAYALGKAAAQLAIDGENAVMPIIERTNNAPYQWKVGKIELSKVANVEKQMPRNFISEDGYSISQQAWDYLLPLIKGEAYPPYDDNGIPQYVRLKNQPLEKKLPQFDLPSSY